MAQDRKDLGFAKSRHLHQILLSHLAEIILRSLPLSFGEDYPNECRALDLGRLARAMATPRMADLRNIYAEDDVTKAGFVAYVSVGRGTGV